MKHKDQSKQVAANLRAIIERHGITHQALADSIIKEKNGRAQPITRQAVTGLLTHKYSPTVQVLFQYLNAVNGIAGTNYELKNIQP